MKDKEEKKIAVEELLCLQLLGYSSSQIYETIQIEGPLNTMAFISIRELDKARRILDRQAKAEVVTIPYYDEAYPVTFAVYVKIHRRSFTCWAMRNCSIVKTM